LAGGDGGDEARLPCVEAQVLQRARPVVERHVSRSRWRGSRGVPPVRLPPPRAPAAR
jgi:hypothetical protein